MVADSVLPSQKCILFKNILKYKTDSLNCKNVTKLRFTAFLSNKCSLKNIFQNLSNPKLLSNIIHFNYEDVEVEV